MWEHSKENNKVQCTICCNVDSQLVSQGIFWNIAGPKKQKQTKNLPHKLSNNESGGSMRPLASANT